MRTFDTKLSPANIKNMEWNKLTTEEIIRIRKRLGAEIRSEREKRDRRDKGKWTQQKLAEMVGYKWGASIGAIERGEVFPQGAKLVKLMLLLGVRVDEVVFIPYEKRRRPLRAIFEDLDPAVIKEIQDKGHVTVPITIGESMLQKARVFIRREPPEG